MRTPGPGSAQNEPPSPTSSSRPCWRPWVSVGGQPRRSIRPAGDVLVRVSGLWAAPSRHIETVGPQAEGLLEGMQTEGGVGRGIGRSWINQMKA
jgi:hypothetical protein